MSKPSLFSFELGALVVSEGLVGRKDWRVDGSSSSQSRGMKVMLLLLLLLEFEFGFLVREVEADEGDDRS